VAHEWDRAVAGCTLGVRAPSVRRKGGDLGNEWGWIDVDRELDERSIEPHVAARLMSKSAALHAVVYALPSHARGFGTGGARWTRKLAES
jgi:hypothetical protein